MDGNALVAMLYHLDMQCGIVLLAEQDLRLALGALDEEHRQFMASAAANSFEETRHPDPNATLKVYAALQALINATANVHKAIWGLSEPYRTSRQDLRDALKVTDSSPLNVRQEIGRA